MLRAGDRSENKTWDYNTFLVLGERRLGGVTDLHTGNHKGM